ncbi:ATP phosphoribosyltransferase [Lactobacillaceae bacterium L1_55_11]|nr:ATP phosphoribosyltransferase [Lactobacillaceae bacterium L1_55_11]
MADKRLAPGFQDEFGENLKQQQAIVQTITQTLNAAGYTPISSPVLERKSTFDQYQASGVFSLVDQAGNELVLRPDLTLPLARFLAGHRQEEALAKFYYVGDVFRQGDYLSGDYNQETQAGVELVGDASFQAELTAIDQMLDFAQTFGIVDVQVVLSDATLIDTILADFDLSPKQRAQMKAAIEQKNVTIFNQLRDQIPDFPAPLADWPLAFGGQGEEVLEQLTDIDGVAEIATSWQELADAIHRRHPAVAVTVDLAAASPQSYYTGTVIRGFVPSLGQYLFTGGRYDHLLKDQAGKVLPAVGLALKIETILAEWRKNPNAMLPQEPIVMVLAKGRVEAGARQLLRSAGIDNTPLDDPARKLVFDSPDGRYRFILVKASDVLKYLDRGIGDVGIVGSDTMAEQVQNHDDVLDLKTGQAEFVLAGPARFDPNQVARKKIATKYPAVTSAYFQDLGEDVEMIKLEGSVELGPLTGLADAIVDISQTGTTLRENHLQVFDHVGPVSTHMVVRRGSLLKYQDELTQVIYRLVENIAGEQS